MKLEPMSDDQIEGIAREAVTDALSFIESEVADDRIKAQKYYNGEVDIGEEEGLRGTGCRLCEDRWYRYAIGETGQGCCRE